MRKLLLTLLNTVALLGMASMAFAANQLDSSSLGTACLAAALGIGIAAFGCAIGMGLGLKGIPFLSEFWIFQILLQVPCEIHILLPDEGCCPIVKMPTGKSFGPSGLSLVPLWKRRAGGGLLEPSSTLRPSLSTTMWLAAMTVLRRCATISTVRP